MSYFRVTGASSLCALLLFGQTAPLMANPTGGAVVAGSATIGAAGKTLNINQSSNSAIINWHTFSIASGETTRFFVPNSSASTLNFVAGGNPSAIYGTLSSNGHLFLINPSGILVGAGGVINTAGFVGSTLNPNTAGTGTILFSGKSLSTIDNRGTISASNGDVYLIANQVSNEGTLSARHGTVGMAAGSSVLLQEKGDQHLFVQAGPTGATRGTGVSNSGSIRAASVELAAAGGNAYALAINNSGSIAATGYKKVGGQVFLTSATGAIVNSGTIRAKGHKHGGRVRILSQTGTITNSGLIDVSATGAGGVGGSVSLKSMGGKVANTGTINAEGGQAGAGGLVDVSGGAVDVGSGVVDTLATGGTTGTFTIDPATLTIAASGGDETGAQVDSQLATTDVDLIATNAITIDDGITWTSGNTLSITTQAAGSTVAINAPISGVNGGLTIDTAGADDAVTTSNAGSVDVANFTLESGAWTQIVGQNGLTALPAFTVANNFALQGSSTFARFAGGNGTSASPYQVTDVYGLQGIGSPGGTLLSDSFVLDNSINAAGTANWTSSTGTGFTPIGTLSFAFTGTFNGGGNTISGLTIDLPNASNVGLFSATGASALVENVNLTADAITGDTVVGALVGQNAGTVTASSATGTVVAGTSASLGYEAGGLVGVNAGTVESSSSSGLVTAAGNNSFALGGLVGENNGTVETSQSSSAVSGTGTTNTELGGLVGENDGTVTSSYATGSVTASSSGSGDLGGLAGYNTGTVTLSYATGTVAAGSNSSNAGGLAGYSNGTIEQSYATGAVTGTSSGDAFFGGLVGSNGGTIASSYATGTVTGSSTGNEVGGLVGFNAASGTLTASYASGDVSGNLEIGGLAGENAGGTISNSSAYGNVTGSSASSYTGGLVGYNAGTVTSSFATGAVNGGDLDVGGLAGYNAGTIGTSFATGAVSTGTGAQYVGGLVGDNATGTVTGSYATGSVTVGNASIYVGGLVGENGELGQSGALVTSSYATGAVSTGTGVTDIGGLAGANTGTVTTSYATGGISGGSGSNSVGGLVGDNQATGVVSLSYASGTVSGSDQVGGLVGASNGVIESSYASGSVEGDSNSVAVGGLVGTSTGTIEISFATGDVTGASDVGGLVGFNNGLLETSYATGAVESSEVDAGGLVGDNGGTIETCYSIGSVEGETFVGALVGNNGNGTGGSVATSYYASDVGGNSDLSIFGETDDGTVDGDSTGLPLASMMQAANFQTSGTGVPNWDFANTWTTNGDTTTPLLKALSVNITGSTPGATDQVDLLSQGSVFASTTASNSTFSFYVPDNVVTSGALLTDVTGNSAATYYVAGTIPTAAISAPLNIDVLTIAGTGIASNTALANAVGSLSGVGANFSVSGSNLTGDGEVEMYMGSSGYQLDGNITLSNVFVVAGTDLVGSANVNVDATEVQLTGNINDTGALTLSTAGTGGLIELQDVGTTGAPSYAGGLTLVSGDTAEVLASKLQIGSGGFTASGSSNSDGVDIEQSEIVSSGAIAITGTGGISAGDVTAAGYGVYVAGSTLTATGTAGISISGVNTTTGTVDIATAGVEIAYLDNGPTVTSQISTANGLLYITGTVSGLTVDTSYTGGDLVGVDIAAGSTVGAGGTGGAVAIIGNASGSTNELDGDQGVHITGYDSDTSTVLTTTISSQGNGVAFVGGGNTYDGLYIQGTSGTTDSNTANGGSDAAGIKVQGGTSIIGGGAANVTMIGTGGTNVDTDGSGLGSANGIQLSANTVNNQGGSILVSSTSGALQLSGTGGTSDRVGIGVDIVGRNATSTNQVSVTLASTSGGISINGTGGSGYTGNGTISGNSVPNFGVGIIDDVTLLSGGSAGIQITGTGGTNSSDVAIEEVSDATLDPNPVLPTITSSGLAFISGTGTNSVALDAAITAPSIFLGSGGALAISQGLSTGALTVTATGTVTDAGAVSATSFTLGGGTWQQIVGQNGLGALPGFADSGDFELEGSSTFERFAGGAGTTGSPYQITDVFGLQGIGSPSGTLLGDSFVLNNDIDADVTANWNGVQGFAPIGNDSSPYTGTFNGAGFTINGLTIARPFTPFVGLFGKTGTSGMIEDLTLSNSSIIGAFFVGGLVGLNTGTVTGVTGSGTITSFEEKNSTYDGISDSALAEVGGLVGANDGVITNSQTSGVVTADLNGSYNAGGVVGENYNGGTVSLSSSSASVSGYYSVGGLVGGNDTYTTGTSTVINSYSTGLVTDSSLDGGGLVGYNSCLVANSYSTAIVDGLGDYHGGLVGNNTGGTVQTSFATGAVIGGTDVGGLVGLNSGLIQTTYSTGQVSGSGSVGGLVGANTGTVQTSYWAQDIGLNAGLNGIASSNSNVGATPETLAAMEQQSTFTPAGTGAPNWDFTNVWTTNGNTNTPQLTGLPATTAPILPTGDTLSGTAFTDSGVTASGSGVTIDLLYDGTVLGTTTTNGSGGFTFDVSSTELGNGLVLTDASTSGNTYFQYGGTSTSLTGVDIWGSNLRIVADTASNSALKTAIGSLTGDGINYSFSGTNLSTANANISFHNDVNDSVNLVYTLDGNITAGGSLSEGANQTLAGSANVTLSGSSVTMSGSFNRTGALTVTSTSGPITLNGVGSSGTPATTAGLTLTSAGNLTIEDSFIALSSGSFTASGTGYESLSNAGGDPDGIDIIGSTINGGSGNITLTGTGGYVFSGSVGPDGGLETGNGVFIQDDANNTLIETSGAGNITIAGSYNHNITTYGNAMGYTPGTNGVAILGGSNGHTTTTTLSVATGTLAITGTISAGTSGDGTSVQLATDFDGVDLDGATIEATGTGGSVSITGNTSGTTVYDNASDGSSDNDGILIGGNDLQTGNTVISVATDGSLSLNGTGGTIDSTHASSFDTTGNAAGIQIATATQFSGGTGATLSLTGQGGAAVTNDGGTAAADASYTGSADGVEVGDAGNTSNIAQISVGTGGSITVTGTGGTMNTSNDAAPPANEGSDVQGVHIRQSTVTANGSATINIQGTGGTVTSGSNLNGGAIGTVIGDSDSSHITTTMISSGSGLISISGMGGASPTKGIGVVVVGGDGSTTEVESTSGSIAITGTGGSGYAGTGVPVNSYIPNYGVGIIDASTLQTGGTGAITITGKGGDNSADVGIMEITNDADIDTAPVPPTVTAGGVLNITGVSGSGNILNGAIMSASGTVSGGPMTITASLTTTGSVTFSSTGTITANGTVSAGSFVLENGTWQQIVGQNGLSALPTFTDSGNFALQNSSTFERFAGGAGTSGSPYQITDVYGLQGIGSPSDALLGDSFVLNNDISALATANWNSGAGFVPIGIYNGSNSNAGGIVYQGTFNGQSHTISGLTINLPGSSYAGLFGDTGDSSTIENINLTSVKVVGGAYVGGLVGVNNAAVSNSSSSGTVTGNTYVGGLLGITSANTSGSSSAGVVNSTGSGADMGGLVGYAQGGTLSTSSSSAAVTGSGNGIGGLVGFNGGTVETSYATGAVGGASEVGGLVGLNGGVIETTYSIGHVSGSSDVGGLVGESSGSVETSYWLQDSGVNTGLFGVGSTSSNAGATPETLAALEQQATFLPAGTGVPNWDFANTWTTQGNTTTPQLLAAGGTGTDTLSGTAYIDSGVTVSTGDITISLIYNGNVLDTTSVNGSGGFTFNVASTDVGSGLVLTDGGNGSTYFQSSSAATSFTGIDIWGSTLRIVASAVNNSALKAAIGSLIGNGINYAVDSNNNLTTNSGINIDVAGTTNYTLDGSATATAGSLTTEAGSALSSSANVTLAASSMKLAGSLTSTGTVTVSPTGTATVSGAVSVGGFILGGGTWQQIVGQNGLTSLPTFTDSGDFELQNSSTFARFAGGAGTTGSPYQVTDVYGLQGIGSPSGALLGDAFVVNNNIDASSTTNWNTGGGFIPIGTSATAFTGTFNGANFTINGLYINQPDIGAVGLFGETSGATITSVNLTNADVTGGTYVGALVGLSSNDGLVEHSSSSGSVSLTGYGWAGGLVGYNNNSTVSFSDSSATVNSTFVAGGLVGENASLEDATFSIADPSYVQYSYSTGSVTTTSDSSDSFAGGLVGGNFGYISNSFSTASATALNGYAGGISATIEAGSLTNCYSAGFISGTTAGGLVGGLAYGTAVNCFWDLDSQGVTLGVGSVPTNTTPGVTEATTAELESQTFILNTYPTAPWDFTNVWTTNNGTNTPQLIGLTAAAPPTPVGAIFDLSGTAYINSGVTVSPDVQITLIFDGNVIGMTETSNTGAFSFNVSPLEIGSGLLLTDATDNGSTYFQIGTTHTSFTGVDIWGGTLRINADTASNSALQQAIGSLSGNGINYAVDEGNNLTSNSGVNIDIVNYYTLDGNVTAGGSLTTELGATLNSSTSVTLAANSMNLAGSLNSSAGVTINATGTAMTSGTLSVDGFVLENGTWVQAVGQNGLEALPAFTDTGDFELQNGSTFERFAGGNGSTNSPYQITDVYGLQGIGSPSNALLNDAYVLNNDIDASATANWNEGAGFVPIGNIGQSFDGQFNGNNYTISGLTINLPEGSGVGLFGYTGADAVIQQTGLANDSVTGNINTGGLVGGNLGLVETSFANGDVQGSGGSQSTGGLVGGNTGTVEQSESSGTVTGGEFVGGLVGLNNTGGGNINNAYSTANVSGESYVGGLVGQNLATINNTYATGPVSGGESTPGGLAGGNSGTITNSFYDTQTTGAGSGVGSGSSAGVTGATTADLESESFILANSPSTPTWDFTNIWNTNGGSTTPQLAFGGTPLTPPNPTQPTGPTNPGNPGGSGLVPPTIVPQNNPNPDNNDNLPGGIIGGIGGYTGPDFSFTGGLATGTGDTGGDLADTSGNAGQVVGGDVVQVAGGTVGNVQNAAVTSIFGAALGVGVHNSLSSALADVMGGWTDADYNPNDNSTAGPGGNNGEVELDAGDYAIVSKKSAKRAQASDMPPQLQNALNNGALNNMPGH